MESIVSKLQKNYSLSPQSAKLLAEVITIIDVESETKFVKEGSSNNMEYLIFEGICRSYLINSKGDEVTLSFFTSIVAPNLIRTKLNKSILNVQALTKVRLGTFLSEDLMKLMNQNREIELWGNSVLQKELMEKVEKEINQISLSAKDRLIVFREKYEQLENLISHSYIASYLGITKVSLSRIRGELSNK